VIADTSVAPLLDAASGGRFWLLTDAFSAVDVLRRAGATVSPGGDGTVHVSGLAAREVVALLNTHGVAFSEISAHRATLEQAYLELTRDAVEFRATPGQVTR
jgi:ABC-2 type transport system ATP-binding protein